MPKLARLAGRRASLKALLLDQGVAAGLGNIYTDEALHAARLHPLAASDSVKREQAERLHEAIRAVLAEGAPDALLVYLRIEPDLARRILTGFIKSELIAAPEMLAKPGRATGGGAP